MIIHQTNMEHIVNNKKRCRFCEKFLPLSEFSTKTTSGRYSYCHKCSVEINRLYRESKRSVVALKKYKARMLLMYKNAEVFRFWTHVDKNGKNDCWVWKLPLRMGYGRFNIKGKMVSAHRYSYELIYGHLDKEITLDHLCRNRACVNPAHLDPVSMRINILRGIGPTAMNAKKTMCIKGHELNGDNLYISPDGNRYCRTCRKERALRNKDKKHESDRKWRLAHLEQKHEIDRKYRERIRLLKQQ